jgi:hypothetical protein
MRVCDFVPMVGLIPFDDSVYHGKNVAIIGNSHLVEGTGHGEEVDEHDIVVRCNSCFPFKYPNDIGKKTSIWATNCCKVMKEPVYNLGEDVMIVCYRDIRSATKQAQVSHFLRRPEVIEHYNSRLYFVEASVTRETYRYSKRMNVVRYPSLGFVVLAHLMLMGEKVGDISLYGFSFYEEDNSTNCHDAAKEKQAVLDITKKYDKVRIYLPLGVSG